MLDAVSRLAAATLTLEKFGFNVNMFTEVRIAVELAAVTPLDEFVLALYTIDFASGVIIDVAARIAIVVTL